MADRRRINGPAGSTSQPNFDFSSFDETPALCRQPIRSRKPGELRRLFLKTGLTPSASGSAYLELEQGSTNLEKQLLPPSSTLKLSCSVHGPRPLPRSSPFTPNMLLYTHVKFAPFATRYRRGYLKDSIERDLAVHLETALRGVIISDRWPKSGLEVIVTILEDEEGSWWGNEAGLTLDRSVRDNVSGLMSVLSGCITVSSAAIIDAGIDCIDTVSGGHAAIVKRHAVDATNDTPNVKDDPGYQVILDPEPSQHEEILATCVVGYLKSRDEITELWVNGKVPVTESKGSRGLEQLIDGAVQVAVNSALVVVGAIRD